MSEIKAIIEKMKTNGTEYHDLRLLIAKRVWLIVASIYYLSYLFTVGGFYFGPLDIDTLSSIRFHLYSVLVIATIWFFYSLCEYGIAIHAPNKKTLLYGVIGIGIIFGFTVLSAHLGII